jgi:hypothetical protein
MRLHGEAPAPEVISVPEASRRQWTVAEVIGVPEVLMFNDVVRWTRVTSLFVGHKNICKYQKTIMTL